MLDFKELAENILTDLMNDKLLSDILLKMKIFASVRKDDELLDWVIKELNGYEEVSPPKYRILPSGLKIKVYVPYQGDNWIEFPAELVRNDQVRERLSNLPFHQSITEIENISKSCTKDSLVKVRVPVYAFSYFSEFINGDIQDAYQYTTPAAVSQIVVSIKSVLIDFLLEIDKEENINFNTFIKTNPQMITNNYFGIINTGSGEINAEGATIVNGDNNIISTDNKQELLKILAEIDKIAAPTLPNTDYEEVLEDIKAELQKAQPEKKFLKRCFQAIPSFLMGVTSSVAGNGLTQLIKSAIGLLS